MEQRAGWKIGMLGISTNFLGKGAVMRPIGAKFENWAKMAAILKMAARYSGEM